MYGYNTRRLASRKSISAIPNRVAENMYRLRQSAFSSLNPWSMHAAASSMSRLRFGFVGTRELPRPSQERSKAVNFRSSVPHTSMIHVDSVERRTTQQLEFAPLRTSPLFLADSIYLYKHYIICCKHRLVC